LSRPNIALSTSTTRGTTSSGTNAAVLPAGLAPLRAVASRSWARHLEGTEHVHVSFTRRTKPCTLLLVQPRRTGTFARALFAGLSARYDPSRRRALARPGRRWRHELIDHNRRRPPRRRARRGHRPAGVALDLAPSRCQARIVGIDVSQDMLVRGRRNVAAAGLDDPHRPRSWARANAMPFPDATFDALTLHPTCSVTSPTRPPRSPSWPRVVRTGGAMASLEFAVPPKLFWRGWWWLYTRVALPLAGAALGGGMVRRRSLPRTQHHRSLPRFPVPATVRRVAGRPGSPTSACRRMSLGGGLGHVGRRRTVEATGAPGRDRPHPSASPGLLRRAVGCNRRAWADWWLVLHPPTRCGTSPTLPSAPPSPPASTAADWPPPWPPSCSPSECAPTPSTNSTTGRTHRYPRCAPHRRATASLAGAVALVHHRDVPRQGPASPCSSRRCRPQLRLQPRTARRRLHNDVTFAAAWGSFPS
jgi:demethylmenaquinone methyltransferase/2-methoxy-6-polyprenyl-1,4-benzoquinol methylase